MMIRMNRLNVRLATVAVLCSLFTGMTAMAAPVSTATNGATGDFSADPADLGNAPGSSIFLTAGSAAFGSSASNLINGTLYGALIPDDTMETLTPTDGSQIVITLPASTGGHDITSIVSTTGAGNGQFRSQQNYSLEISQVGSAEFSPLFSVPTSLEGNVQFQNTEVQIITVDDTAAALATAVDEIRITFFDGSGDNVETMYREFDIFSVASTAPGDFDNDGDVDGADFVIWQTNFPTASGGTLATGDADGDGDVDGADFVVWQTNFPFTPSPGVSSVPEPHSLVLAAMAGLIVAVWRRGKQ